MIMDLSLFRRILLGVFCTVLSVGFLQVGFAQSVNTNYCSTNIRGSGNSETYTAMYKNKLKNNNNKDFVVSYLDTFLQINWDTSVVGQTTWYDNRKGGCNNGGFLGNEISTRNTWWTNFHQNKAGVTNSQNITKSEMTKMQEYINKSCALNVSTDGRLGKRTVNSVKLCKPPCLGKCGWDLFEELAKKTNILFYDKEGKKPVYANNNFNSGDPTQQLYVSLSGLSSVPNGMTAYLNAGSPVTLKDNSDTPMINALGLGVVEEPAPEAEKPTHCKDSAGNFLLTQSQYDALKAQGYLIDKPNSSDYCYITRPPETDTNAPTTGDAQIKTYQIGLSLANNTIQQLDPIPTLADLAKIDLELAVAGEKNKPSEESVVDNKPTCPMDIPKKVSGYDKEEHKKGRIDKKCQCDNGYTKKNLGGGYIACEKCDMEKCNCGVKLNTNVPFIGRCIMYGDTNNTDDPEFTGGDDSAMVVNQLNAFPILMGGLVKILMSVIMLVCFASLIVAGVMMTIPGQYDTGKSLIKKVVFSIVILGVSGVILYLINPNFFF